MMNLTPKGRVSKSEIDVLISRFGSDEWLPDAMKGPLWLALSSSAAALVLLAIHAYFQLVLQRAAPEVLVGILAVWPLLIVYSCCEMYRLRRQRNREN